MSGTGGIDASIPLQARTPTPTNPLQTIGEFANVQNALNQNKLFPGALALQGGQQTLQGQQIQSGQSNLIQQQRTLGYASLVPTLAKKGPITLDDLTTALAGAEKSGVVTQPVLSELSSIPLTGNPAVDDANFRAHIAANSQAPANAAAQVTPQPAGGIGTGPDYQPLSANPAGLPNAGQVAPGGAPIPVYPSREAQLGQVTWEDSAGVKHYGTQADWAKARGQDALIGPATPSSAPAPSLGTGRFPTAPAPPTGSIAGPSPGTPENATASALAAHSANQRASTFASDMFPLQQAQTALANAPTGKGSEAAHAASSYINTFAPAFVQKGLSFISPIMTPDQQAAYDEAKKYTTQIQLNAPGATRSNEGQSAAGAANPSVEISPQAAQLVIKGMIGLRRMEQDSTLEFNKSGLPPAAYDKFQTQFATQADPRAYMFDQMNTAQRQQTLSSFKTTAARNAFIQQVERAEQNKVLTAPGATNAQ